MNTIPEWRLEAQRIIGQHLRYQRMPAGIVDPYDIHLEGHGLLAFTLTNTTRGSMRQSIRITKAEQARIEELATGLDTPTNGGSSNE